MKRFVQQVGAGVCALALLLSVGGAAALGSSVSAGPVSTAGGRQHWVTLVTGDRVLLQVAEGHERVVTVQAGAGRDGVAFRQQSDQGDLYVMPADALSLVASGQVDRRLFNVSMLVEFGYDDRTRDEVPLIVTYGAGPSRQFRLSPASGQVTRGLPSIGGDALAVAKAAVGGFWEAAIGTQPQILSTGLTRVWLDGQVTASLDRSVPQVGAPVAWTAGHTGAGATVAVLDSGVDDEHPDLADAVVAAEDFTGSETGTDDLFGHGTHVAGIITGDGSASGGRYVGVAPDAMLLNGKVLDDVGEGAESGLIAGMEWAVGHGADVVNLSLGGWPTDGTDPVSHAVNVLTRESGTLFVAAAGNDGPDGGISSPGSADEALTVGAVDAQDSLAEFSSRGPRRHDLALKPDITAPGVGIVAPLADGGLLGRLAPVVDGRYLVLDGTSMAAQHPGWDADELKPTLMSSAAPREGLSVYEQGTGRLDVGRAVSQQVFATSTNLDYGIVRWPHDDDEPIGRSVTYRNDGAVAVTLDLTVDARGPGGTAAPTGMFALSPGRVTVPAGGTASVELLTDTSVPAPDGTYGGLLTATDGQITVRKPIGVTREVESYDVTLTFLDRTGRLTPDYFTRFVGVGNERVVVRPYDDSGTVVARLPKGRYYFEGTIAEDFETGRFAMLVEPTINVTGDLELVVDAGRAKPVGITVDQPDARPAEADVIFARRTSWDPTGTQWFLNSFDDLSVQPSTTTAPGEFTFFVGGRLAQPDGAGGFAESPYLYHVQWWEDGRVPTDLIRRVRDRELATVHTTIASSAPDQIASKDWILDVTTPARLVERYTPGVEHYPAVALRDAGTEDAFDSYAAILSEPVTYQRGKTLVERWNVGVSGPAFGQDAYVARMGNTLGFALYLFGDQAPGHYGWSLTESVEVTLFRDGSLLGQWEGEVGELAVPAEPGTYRLAATATRSIPPLSTAVATAWTFESSQIDGYQPLPVAAVRFAPDLDQRNRAPAGVPFTVPVQVQQQIGADFGHLRSLTVEVSYDDGESWRPVPLFGTGPERIAVVNHPRADGFVSLRVTAADREGNAVEQTIIRAYALKLTTPRGTRSVR